MHSNTCDLYDQFGDQARVASPIFQDFGGQKSFTGRVTTIKCFEDNSRLKELVATPGKGGSSLWMGGSKRYALMGDMIAKEAMASGWEGVIIYGCVRDKAVLATLDIGIKALGTTPRKLVKNGEGQVDIPMSLAGIECRPGDQLFADEDGILVLGRISTLIGRNSFHSRPVIAGEIWRNVERA